jgi:hypothetical protein
MLKIPVEYDRDASSTKLTDISRQVPLCFAIGVSAGICQRALVDESGMIRTQMVTHNRSGNGHSAWDVLYDTTP